jgi:hypothetical protein
MPTIITGETGVNQITSGTIVGADVSSSLDLTGKTVTLPSGAITSANLPAGSVLQVVNATYSTYTSTTGTTYVDTGLSASITPSSSSNKILVIVHQAECGNTNSNIGIRLQVLRNSTSIIIPATPGLYGMVYANATISTAYLDSPATTSSVTYKTQFRLNDPTGTAYVQGDSATSTITLMEIKA